MSNSAPIYSPLRRAILGTGRYHLARSNERGERFAVCGFRVTHTDNPMNVRLDLAEKKNGSESRCRRCFGG